MHYVCLYHPNYQGADAEMASINPAALISSLTAYADPLDSDDMDYYISTGIIDGINAAKPSRARASLLDAAETEVQRYIDTGYDRDDYGEYNYAIGYASGVDLIVTGRANATIENSAALAAEAIASEVK